ncbi:hypothetical protein FrEUN1fDRAFT_7391 [Parafrankia sp. EUN1f]|nr:hypothetical protein FrEUN1fDRAFT_7391 [Parafrankia sp. EUN1f]
MVMRRKLSGCWYQGRRDTTAGCRTVALDPPSAPREPPTPPGVSAMDRPARPLRGLRPPRSPGKRHGPPGRRRTGPAGHEGPAPRPRPPSTLRHRPAGYTTDHTRRDDSVDRGLPATLATGWPRTLNPQALRPFPDGPAGAGRHPPRVPGPPEHPRPTSHLGPAKRARSCGRPTTMSASACTGRAGNEMLSIAHPPRPAALPPVPPAGQVSPRAGQLHPRAGRTAAGQRLSGPQPRVPDGSHRSASAGPGLRRSGTGRSGPPYAVRSVREVRPTRWGRT